MTNVNNFQSSTSIIKSKSVENTLLLFLFVIGVLGTIYFFKEAKQDTLTQPVYFSNLEQSGSIEVTSTLETGRNYLSIFGVPEKDAPIEFAFEHLEENSSYFLDFGDGKKIDLNASLAIHSYEKSGTFQIKLIQKATKKEKIIQEKTIRIKASTTRLEAMTY